MTAIPAQSDRRLVGCLASLGLLLVPLLARAQGPMVFVPYWESDPLRSIGLEPNIGLTPWWSMLFDCVSLLGAAGLIVFAPPARKRWVLWVLLGLAALGTFGALHHGWMIRPGGGTFKTRLIACAWVSAVVGAVAVREACRDARVKAVTFAVLTGLVLMLACKGVMQYFWEHAQTLEAFRANRQQIFADNGWAVDSPMARSYERRVSQAEASGWFGFSNVFATFGAAGLAGFTGLLLASRRSGSGLPDKGRSTSALMLGGAVLCALAVVLAGSKGGYAVAGLGVWLVIAGAWVVRRRLNPRLGLVVAPGLVGLTLLAVVMRGMVGERIHELSLLFRWFYMQAAGRIFAGHPWFGVGPDGFQEAYALAKNPLSPEDVSSPHSVMLDWAACLGVFGLAWAVLFLVLLALAGRALLSPAKSPVTHTRWLIRAACLMAAISVAIAIPFQHAAILPEEAIGVRLLGLVLWCVGAGAALVIAARSDLWRVGLFAAAVVVAVHCQIELTGVLPQSVGLAMVLIGAASACHGPGLGQVRAEEEARTSQSGGPWHVRWCALLPLGLAVFFLLRGALLAHGWESKLADAYNVLEAAAPVRAELREEERTGGPEAAHLMNELMGEELRLIPEALRKLPLDQWPVRRAASELAVAYSRDLLQAGRPADAKVALLAAYEYVALPFRATDLIGNAAQGGRPEMKPSPIPAGLTISQHNWLATIALELARAGLGNEWLVRASEHLAAAEAHDPYTPQHAARLMEVYEQLGDKAKAREAAQRALKANDLQRLDKDARGLDDRVRAKAERLAK